MLHLPACWEDATVAWHQEASIKIQSYSYCLGSAEVNSAQAGVQGA